MLSSEATCSDCRLEHIQKKWTKLLLKWVNKCVNDKHDSIRDKMLSGKLLLDIMTKYKVDVCEDDIERALLCNDEIEPFIKFKYPILRLSYLTEAQDLPKKLYIMTSMLLYHCCIKSREGVVHNDIYNQMTKYEQEMILKFCERLNDMETTLNNVEFAIQEAFASTDRCKYTDSSAVNSEEGFKGIKSSDTIKRMSSVSTLKNSFATLRSNVTLINESLALVPSTKLPPMKFTSSITVLPSVVADAPSYYNSTVGDYDERMADHSLYVDSDQIDTYVVKTVKSNSKDDKDKNSQKRDENEKKNDAEPHKDVQKECTCSDSSVSGRRCSEAGNTMGACVCKPDKQPESSKLAKFRKKSKITAMIVVIGLFVLVITVLSLIISLLKEKMTSSSVDSQPPEAYLRTSLTNNTMNSYEPQDGWKCTKNLCQKVYQSANQKVYLSYSRCTLQCTGPQIWPHPIGSTVFGSKVIALATSKLEYKLKTVSSESVRRYLAEALKLFIGDLAKLENIGKQFETKTSGLNVKKMNIQIEVQSDADPRLRLNTEEAYQITIETIDNQVFIRISSSSFCGVRHGLETLTQMILLDERTGYLISVSKAHVKDAPSYKYRGLMIDTGRNYIPVGDLMRTIDGMATVKLNTFHWRISDVASFPLFLPKVAQLFENGAYDRSMIYSKKDVKSIVKRAGIRGIRVLIEVAAPGPVGRPWSWSIGSSCPKHNDTCDNILCTILDTSDLVMNILQDLYEDILEMTQVDDVFHMSNGVFSLANCYNLMDKRDGFLDKALDSLKRANKGFLPKLPIVWYTQHLNKDFESKTWERFGVQLNEWKSSPSEQFLAKFKVIHSSRWELSCEMKNQRCKRYRSWQEMYAWKSWLNLEAFTVEGGEAILWTDLVNSGNLDYHLWPRAAAVAERLWSDIIANGTADKSVYVRLNSHRFRMMHVGVKMQPIWPAWCISNPGPCLSKVEVR